MQKGARIHRFASCVQRFGQAWSVQHFIPIQSTGQIVIGVQENILYQFFFLLDFLLNILMKL